MHELTSRAFELKAKTGQETTRMQDCPIHFGGMRRSSTIFFEETLKCVDPELLVSNFQPKRPPAPWSLLASATTSRRHLYYMRSRGRLPIWRKSRKFDRENFDDEKILSSNGFASFHFSKLPNGCTCYDRLLPLTFEVFVGLFDETTATISGQFHEKSTFVNKTICLFPMTLTRNCNFNSSSNWLSLLKVPWQPFIWRWSENSNLSSKLVWTFPMMTRN